ncbi:MAG: phosphatidate cytidylyltransferase [Rhodospirillales bacterium]|jgi:phosphatidate cytidylyltransferase|nr:phosphatidate cytidylyltransferase [Rhodospirillaceae bacterium]MDP6430131.1 phosphatidate cytidylyltransferase [Rhodospirillales bacterium]MDP6645635.1 phosphatidate cytidylyltransferase [Rhodospirillales bacterium]|tara:strand:- start:566 stop:1363 length:798 start_codon:yes stop_codon:yes gene_type:complete
MIPRLVSSIILIPPVLAAIWFGSPYFEILVLIVGLIALFEWCRIARAGETAWPGHIAILVFAVALVSYFFQLVIFSWSMIGLGFVVLVILGWRTDAAAGPWPAIGLIYVGIACIALVELRADPAAGRQIILWLMLVIWATDIGAYLFGRMIGGVKLAPRISPNKTWAGLLGGIGCAIAVAAIIFAATPVKQGIMLFVVLSAAVAVVSQAGDLLESWLKRRFGVKDSGNLIPGHGGILDRIDGILLSAPAVAIVYWLYQGGNAPWK